MLATTKGNDREAVATAYAHYHRLEAGGEPSTWLPPEGLVEHQYYDLYNYFGSSKTSCFFFIKKNRPTSTPRHFFQKSYRGRILLQNLVQSKVYAI